MNKRYQVFLSSTYRDLQEERLEVLKALLELDCIPCGMEYFPAANDETWDYIADLIRGCDYYIVIVAGRYGSTDSDGLSYTQKEYEFAAKCGIPSVAFIHSDAGLLPLAKSETDPVARERLDNFLALLKRKLCKEWSSVHELGAVVSRSLTQLIRKYPRPGWVPATSLASAAATQEILDLHRRIETLEAELARLRPGEAVEASELARGDDQYTLQYDLTYTRRRTSYQDPVDTRKFECEATFTWNEIFGAIGAHLMADAKESVLATSINRLVRGQMTAQDEVIRGSSKSTKQQLAGFYPSGVRVHDQCCQQIKVHLVALGLIELWTVEQDGKLVRMSKLTPHGTARLVDVFAVKRVGAPRSSGAEPDSELVADPA